MLPERNYLYDDDDAAAAAADDADDDDDDVTLQWIFESDGKIAVTDALPFDKREVIRLSSRQERGSTQICSSLTSSMGH